MQIAERAIRFRDPATIRHFQSPLPVPLTLRTLPRLIMTISGNACVVLFPRFPLSPALCLVVRTYPFRVT